MILASVVPFEQLIDTSPTWSILYIVQTLCGRGDSAKLAREAFVS
jgi:hypothetical protein